jgi:hypothetical protein
MFDLKRRQSKSYARTFIEERRMALLPNMTTPSRKPVVVA